MPDACCQPGGQCACSPGAQSLPDPAVPPDHGLRVLPVIRGTNTVQMVVGWQGDEVFVQTLGGLRVWLDAGLLEVLAQTLVRASWQAAGAVSAGDVP